jgi:hypothetical protein
MARMLTGSDLGADPARKLRKKRRWLWVVFGVVAFVVVFGIVFAPKDDDRTATTTQASNTTGRYTIVVDSYLGCVNKADWDTMLTYSSQRDEAAFTSAGTLGLAAGTMTMFKKGEVVFLMDSTWTGSVLLRREGEITTYWTAKEGIGK